MKKRMTKSKQQVEVQQLSPREIKEREEVYRKDLTDFRSGLIAGERFKKDGIKKLARDLEEAGTIDTHKISTRIKGDLKEMIDRGLLHTSYTSYVLEDKYKIARPKTSRKSDSFSSGDTQTQTQTTDTDSETESPKPSAEQAATEPSKPSPQSVEEEQKQDQIVSDLYNLVIPLTEMLTGYRQEKIQRLNDNLALTSETRKFRQNLTMALYPLDLKTIYDFSRTLGIILNDFLKQLENELDSRRKKQHITSE